MRSILSLMLAGGLSVALTTPTSAAVLCKTRAGVIVMREACKKKEAPVDLSQFGAVGPAGPPGTAGATGPAGLAAWERPCPPDAVLSGTTCIDRFEASVWRVPNPLTTNAGLVAKIAQGTATAADLAAGAATALGTASDNYAPCADNGQNCSNDIYAVSLPGVIPSANLTWFQAQQACTNARKRLPSNAEWQAAVTGTPDSGPANLTTDCTGASVHLTGSRSGCVSASGGFDLVGNLYEWVAEWMPRSTSNSGTWSAGVSPTGDIQNLAGAATDGEPGALLRGGFYGSAEDAGPLAVRGEFEPSFASYAFGFRCAR